MNYFAYGSNMALARLRERVPSARFVGVFMLKNHDLRFHQVGRDGSAKCDAVFTGSHADVVEGVVFEIDPREVIDLDRAEDLGKGYHKKYIQASNLSGNRLEAFIYVAARINESMLPFSWYKNHVLVGARSAPLSLGYTARIEAVRATNDPDQARAQRQFAIHDGPT